MKERNHSIALSLATVMFMGAGCIPNRGVEETITSDGRRAVKTDCVQMNRIFQRQPIAFACPDAIVTVERNPDKSLTLFSDPETGGLTVQFSDKLQIGGIGAAELCSIFFEIQSGEVKSMKQSCSFPSGE